MCVFSFFYFVEMFKSVLHVLSTNILCLYIMCCTQCAQLQYALCTVKFGIFGFFFFAWNRNSSSSGGGVANMAANWYAGIPYESH